MTAIKYQLKQCYALILGHGWLCVVTCGAAAIWIGLSLQPWRLDGWIMFIAGLLLGGIVYRTMAPTVKMKQLAIKTAQLEQARTEAESATASKSEFLANMSHEIRTPLTAILGYSDLLSEETDVDQASEERISAIRTIQRSGQHLLTVMNDILDLSNIESGKLSVETIPISPVQIVSDVISLMHHQAKEKQLFLKVQYENPIPQTICTDPTRLRQILVNLIGNAIKFTNQGGVHVIVTLVDAPHAHDPRIRFTVIDTGIGLDPKQLSHLFQAFSQGDRSTTRFFGGTGLGLIITKRLSQMLGGDVTVTTRQGQGSTFVVTVKTGSLKDVPMFEKFQDLRVTEKPPSNTTRAKNIKVNGRILLAEDGLDNQRLVGLVLRKAGATVTIAENGRIAYENAMQAWHAGKPFDLILMDMQMPELDGYDATRLLRKENYKGPIVALTAHAMAGDREKCLEAGCNDYATKPIDRVHLLSMIADIVSGGEKQNASPNPEQTESIHNRVRKLSDQITAIQNSLAVHDLGKLQKLAQKLETLADEQKLEHVVQYARTIRQTARTTLDLSGLDTLVQQLANECRGA